MITLSKGAVVGLDPMGLLSNGIVLQVNPTRLRHIADIANVIED